MDIDGCSGCTYENLTIKRFKDFAREHLSIDIDAELAHADGAAGIEMDTKSLKDPSMTAVRFYRTFNGYRTNWGFEQYVEMPKSYIETELVEHDLHSVR
jgi:hypothetical protein